MGSYEDMSKSAKFFREKAARKEEIYQLRKRAREGEREAFVPLFELSFQRIAKDPKLYDEAIKRAGEAIEQGANPDSWQTYERVGTEFEQELSTDYHQRQAAEERRRIIEEMRTSRISGRPQYKIPEPEEA